MMERRTAKRITGLILAVGLTAAAIIYATATPPTDDPFGYVPLENKKYIMELERYGGKANVAASEFMAWFDSLWHGRSLAYTVAVLTAATAWAFWFFATIPPLEEANEQQSKSETTD